MDSQEWVTHGFYLTQAVGLLQKGAPEGGKANIHAWMSRLGTLRNVTTRKHRSLLVLRRFVVRNRDKLKILISACAREAAKQLGSELADLISQLLN